MKQAILDFAEEPQMEPPAEPTPTGRRVTSPAHKTACAAAPSFAAPHEAPRAVDADASNAASCPESKADSKASVVPAGPRSRAARIIALARALGVQSDAEAAGQLGQHPF